MLHPPHRLPGGVADGHGGARACPEQSRRVVAVHVVQAAAHAGGEALTDGGRGKRKATEGIDSFGSFSALNGPVLHDAKQRGEVQGIPLFVVLPLVACLSWLS